MRQDGEHRFARRALDTPDGKPTQAETGIVGVTREAPTRAAAGRVEELKTDREEEGQDKRDKRFGGVKELAVGRFMVEMNGDRAVFACHFGGLAPVSSPCRGLSVQRRHREGSALKDQVYGERISAPPLNPVECENFRVFWVRAAIFCSSGLNAIGGFHMA